MKLSNHYEDEVSFWICAYETGDGFIELTYNTFRSKLEAIQWATENKDSYLNKRLHILPAMLITI